MAVFICLSGKGAIRDLMLVVRDKACEVSRTQGFPPVSRVALSELRFRLYSISVALQFGDGDGCSDGGLNPLHLTTGGQKVAVHAVLEVVVQEGADAGAGRSDLPNEVTAKGFQYAAWE